MKADLKPARSPQKIRGLLWTLACGTLLASGCRGPSPMGDSSRLAEVSIQQLENADYTSYQFGMKQQDGNFSIPLMSYSKGSQTIQAKVPVGTYKISLDYYKDKQLILSAAFCADNVRNDVRKLLAGINSIDLAICNKAAEKVDSSVVIKPVPVKPGTTPAPKPDTKPAVPSDTFSIQNGQLMDPTGKSFVFRGINVPFAYYFDQSLAALDQAKAMGFNSVRIVWCADTYVDGQRCDRQYHLRSPADLDRVLTKIQDLKMVSIFNLQNATGKKVEEVNPEGMTVRPLEQMADYLLKDEVKAVLMKHKKNTIINIANEWLGDWAKNRDWVNGYLSVIPRLRKAGLPHVLIVDSRGYGQDFSSIEESATELLALDKNLLFAAHMYAVFGTDSAVQEKFNYVRTRKIPFIIGEFGCSHFDDSTSINRPVACEAIMREAANSVFPVGTLAWSYTGNRSQEVDLDLVNFADWKTLTSYGEKIVNGSFGTKATSREACIFQGASCR